MRRYHRIVEKASELIKEGKISWLEAIDKATELIEKESQNDGQVLGSTDEEE